MVRYHQTEVGLKQDNRTSDVFPKFFGTEEENELEKLTKEESNC